MPPPDRSAIVNQVHQQHPELLQANTHEACTKFLQYFILACPEEWGHLSKEPHENGYTLPNGVRVSHDVVVHRESSWLVDIVEKGGAPGEFLGKPMWGPIGPQGVDRPWNVYMPLCGAQAGPHCAQRIVSVGPVTPTERQILIGISWFCASTAFRDWRTRAVGDMDVIAAELKPDVYRTMKHVVGGPWVAAAVDVRDPRWRDDNLRLHDQLARTGAKDFITFFGGHEGVPGLDDKFRAIDKICAFIRERPQTSWGAEMVNEWKNIGWERSDVRAMVRHAAPQLPGGFLLAASSPWLAHHADLSTTPQEMLADASALYDGIPATWMTIHLLRRTGQDANTPADPMFYRPLMTHLKKGNTEPRGMGASAGGDEQDVDDIVWDVQRSILALFELYIFHPRWGVFNGEIDPNGGPGWDRYREKSVLDHANIRTMMRAVDAASRGLPVDGGGGGEPGGGGGGGDVPAQPYPDEQTWWGNYEAQVVAIYAEAYHRGLRGSPELDPAAFRWFTRTAYSIGSGHDKDSAAARHLAELRQAIGLG